MMRQKNIFISFLVIFTLVNFTQTQANISRPDIQGRLVYVKEMAENSYQYIIFSNQQRSTFTTSPGQCFAISPDARHGALYEGGLLTVFRFDDQELVVSQPLPSTLEGLTTFCNLRWESAKTVRFSTGTPEQPGRRFALSLDTSSLEEIEPENESRFAQPTPFPDQLVGDIYPPLYGSSGDLVLYARCAPGSFNATEGYCESDQVVVYSRATGNIVEVLENASSFILGEESEEFPVVVPPKAFWSPSGRYLLYASEVYPSAKLKLYDPQADRYLDLPFPEKLVFNELFAGVEWLEGEQPQVGLWVFDANTGMSLEIPQRFLYYDVTLGGMNLSTVSFVRGPFAGNWEWSPDGSAIALVTDKQDLTLLNLASDEATLLDTDVDFVTMWVEDPF